MNTLDQLHYELYQRGLAEPPTLAQALNVEFYAKKKAAANQSGFAWTAQDEANHPRDEEGKWTDKEGGQSNRAGESESSIEPPKQPKSLPGQTDIFGGIEPQANNKEIQAEPFNFKSRNYSRFHALIEKYRFGSPGQFVESQHPRGRPENAGQFTEKGNQSHVATSTSTGLSSGILPKTESRKDGTRGGPKRTPKENRSVPIVSKAKRPNDAADTSITFALTIDQRNYTIRKEGDRWLYADTRRKNWTVLSPKLVPALDKLLLYTHKQQLLSALQQSGDLVGSKLEKQLKLPKDYFLDAYFALADAGQVHQDPSSGKVKLGPAPKSVAQPKVIRVEKTPEQIEAEGKKNEEEARVAAERKQTGAVEVRRARKDEALQQAVDLANEYGIAPDDLLEAAKDIYTGRKRQVEERETAKEQARKMTGLTAGDIQRMENAGHDYTSADSVGGTTGQRLKDFDTKAQQFAREYPGIIGDPDDPHADFAAGLWELLREGRQMLPSMYDDDILHEAARLVKSGQAEPQAEEEAIPFSRCRHSLLCELFNKKRNHTIKAIRLCSRATAR